MAACPTCGAQNEPTAVFCSQCATNITNAGTGVRYNPHAHMPPPQTYGTYGASYMLPSRAGTVLTLGILSLVVCTILGPIAWSMGNEEMRRMDAGETDPSQRGSVNAGRICGIIGTAFLIFSAVIIMFVLVAAGSASSHRW
jgi:hypothetical protein